MDIDEQNTKPYLGHPSHTLGHIGCPACERSRTLAMQLNISPDLTFKEAAALWLDSRSFTAGRGRLVSSKTIRDYAQYIRALNRFFADIPLKDVHAGHLREYQQQRAAGKLGPSEEEIKTYKIRWKSPGVRQVGPNKINQELNTLERILRRANAWTIELEDNYEPFQAELADVPRALSPSEQDYWLQVVASRQRWELVHWYSQVAFHTTCSNIEMRSGKIGDVNLFDRILQVRNAGAKNKYRVRTIPLTDEAFWAMTHIIARARDLGATAVHHHLFPFRDARNVWNPNRGMSESGIKNLWNEVRGAAGLTWFRTHDCRHTAITRLAEAGTPISTIMSMAGHISPRMTQHYTQISEQAKRRALESAFGKPGPRSVVTSMPLLSPEYYSARRPNR